jgi:hypothetical protein
MLFQHFQTTQNQDSDFNSPVAASENGNVPNSILDPKVLDQREDALSSDSPSIQNLRHQLRIAIDGAKASEFDALIAKVIREPGGKELVKDFLRDKSLPEKTRFHAAQVLVGIGTRDSVEAVIKEIIGEYVSGSRENASVLLSALDLPLSLEGCKVLVDVLAGYDVERDFSNPPPEEIQSAIRKSLSRGVDSEGLGEFLADLYYEYREQGTPNRADNLINSIAVPDMLTELVLRSYEGQQVGDAEELWDRLIAVNDFGTVGAVARLAAKQPALLNEASEVLFNWSLQHPQQAQPGLFAEYLNNQTLPPEQRVVAAYGLAGALGKHDARRALEKAIYSESNPTTKLYLQNALTNLEGVEPKSVTVLPGK